jgi:prepilin-type N-terminal cleavage/methylation domain-containing protein
MPVNIRFDSPGKQEVMSMIGGLIKSIHTRERGFTLIELMIVILVILILAGVLIPQMGVARERANKAKCVSNQRNIETAVALWAIDNPGVNYDGGAMDNSTPGYNDLTVAPFYANPSAFAEPDDPNVNRRVGDDYYLSQGNGGGSANPAAPTYGHVVCNYAEDPSTSCGGGDPWVNCYEGNGRGTGLNHVRGAAASP